MHGDHPKFTPEEALPEQPKDNIIEFVKHDKPAEHVVEHIAKEAGSHDSPVFLNESELIKAQVELDKLEGQKKQILMYINKGMMSGFGKTKDEESDKSINVKNLPVISAKIRKLVSDIAFTKAKAEIGEPMSKNTFDKLSPHEKSMRILEKEGFNNIAAAEATQPPADSMLARMIITAKKTAAQAGIDVYAPVAGKSNVITPEGVWLSQPKPEDSEEESKKAA